MSQEIRVCTKCKKKLPATLEFFHKEKLGKNGLRSKCKNCWALLCLEWQNNNKDKVRENGKLNKRKLLKNSKYRKNMYLMTNLHNWIRRHKTEQKYCSICNEEKKLELSNISGEYKRDIKDYWWLCRECHGLFDRTKRIREVMI